jgi:hypothetical protein
MVLRRTPLSAGVSESSIVFFNGGHNHNGTSSALIDTSKYSIYDFTPDFLGAAARQSGPQATNYGKFKEVVARIVKEDVLTTAGIRLLPNQVRAANINAGEITSDKLQGNFVLVNNIISSGNWDGVYNANTKGITDPGTVGWAISSNGDAYFANTSIRGQLQADTVYINAFNQWTSDGDFIVGSNITNNGMFFQSATGNFDITGHIYALGGQIAGWEIDGDNLLSGGGYDGEMVIGPGYGPSTGIGGANSGAMFVSASYNASYTSEVNYNGLNTSWSLRNRVSNDIEAELNIDPIGIVYASGPERISFSLSGGVLYAIIDGVSYCISECGTSIPGTVTVAPATVVVVGGETCTTCNVVRQFAVSCGTAGCFQVWEERVCATGCTCDGTCVNTMIEDCTGPGCGAPAPAFFGPPSFFEPPSFFAPPSFK